MVSKNSVIAALLVAYVVAMAVVSGFENKTVTLFGWLLLVVVFLAVGAVQLVRRRT